MHSFAKWLAICFVTFNYPAAASTLPIENCRNRRIVSAFVGADEIVYDLYAHHGLASCIMALSYLSDDPNYSFVFSSVKDVPFRMGFDTSFLMKEPIDLAVVASFNDALLIRRLEQLGIKVLKLSRFSSIADIVGNIELIGQFVDLNSRFLSEPLLHHLHNRTCKERLTYFQWNSDGLITGSETLFDDVVEKTCGINAGKIIGVKGWQRINPEYYFQMDPHFIVVNQDMKEEVIVAKMMKTPGLRHLEAVIRRRFIKIPSKYLNTISHYVLHLLEKMKHEGG